MDAITEYFLQLLSMKTAIPPARLHFYFFGLALPALILCYAFISYHAMFSPSTAKMRFLRIFLPIVTLLCAAVLLGLLLYACL